MFFPYCKDNIFLYFVGKYVENLRNSAKQLRKLLIKIRVFAYWTVCFFVVILQ